MNNTIKALLLLLFLGVCIITTHAQTVLQQKTHLAREGDVTLKQELQYKSPGRNGRNVIWDFSELSVSNSGYQESFTGSLDSILIKVSPRSKYEYRLVGDSLSSVGYETPTLQIKYLLPELHCRCPMFFGDSIFSLYYS